MRFQFSAASPRAMVAREDLERLCRRACGISGVVPAVLISGADKEGRDPGERLRLLRYVSMVDTEGVQPTLMPPADDCSKSNVPKYDSLM